MDRSCKGLLPTPFWATARVVYAELAPVDRGLAILVGRFTQLIVLSQHGLNLGSFSIQFTALPLYSQLFFLDSSSLLVDMGIPHRWVRDVKTWFLYPVTTLSDINA